MWDFLCYLLTDGIMSFLVGGMKEQPASRSRRLIARVLFALVVGAVVYSLCYILIHRPG